MRAEAATSTSLVAIESSSSTVGGASVKLRCSPDGAPAPVANQVVIWEDVHCTGSHLLEARKSVCSSRIWENADRIQQTALFVREEQGLW